MPSVRPPCPWLSAALLLASILTFACQLSGPADEPREPTESATATESWFTDISDEVGLDFVHESGGAGELHLPEIMGSGAGFLDYDGDGDLDIYVISGNYDFAGNQASAEDARELPTNPLYAQGDDGLLVDVTAESGVGDGGYGMGMASATTKTTVTSISTSPTWARIGCTATAATAPSRT